MEYKVNAPKPSRTAFFNALHRALAHKSYQHSMLGKDYLAEIFLPGYYRFFLRFSKIQNNTKDKLDAAFPGLNAYVTARTAFFDQIFEQALNENIPQIVILGAGYDTRAYRFANLNNNTRIFEIDTPPTQNRKRKCLKKVGKQIPERLTFIPLNLMSMTLKSALDNAGYQSDKKTLFTWEGVSFYLDRESVEKTLLFFRDFSQKDSLIAFDYLISLNIENFDNYYGAKEFFQSMHKEHADETLLFSLKEGEIQEYLFQNGIHLLEHLDSDEIEQRYFTDEHGESLNRITGHFRLVLAKPKD